MLKPIQLTHLNLLRNYFDNQKKRSFFVRNHDKKQRKLTHEKNRNRRNLYERRQIERRKNKQWDY